MNVNLYIIEDYENETAFRPRKNKAKTNPISSKAKMNLKSLAKKSGHTFIFSGICLQLIACLKWGLGYIIKVPAAHLKKDL